MTGYPIFDPIKGTLLIDLEPVQAGSLFTAELAKLAAENSLKKKNELHITLVGFRNGSVLKEKLSAGGEEKISRLNTLLKSTSWSFTPEPEAYSVKKEYRTNEGPGKEIRQTLIRMIRFGEGEKFFSELNDIFDTNLELPPLHITLYSKSTEKENDLAGIGINSWREFNELNPQLVGSVSDSNYRTIILPTRPQPDTIVAIFILKKFGENKFPGIKNASVEFWQMIPDGETESSLNKKGYFLMDVGGGRFDHHAMKGKTTASDLIVQALEISDDPALAKLLEYARRDDFYGKGTISTDPIDRAFGLSSLIAVLNKSLIKNPSKVIDHVLPLLIAHHNEELRRTKELPEEFEAKVKSGEVEMFDVRQRDKKLKVVIVNSESGSLAGYLRSQNGGKFDVVAQRLPSNHVNILTRPTKRPDLRSLVTLLRLEEATLAGYDITLSPRDLARYGRIKEIPEWYYDPATNSIQNGGLNPKEVSPTRIPRDKFKKLMELGISEQLWDPSTS